MAPPATPVTDLGRSLLLTDGDLPLVDGDLALVEGRDNLLQGLRVLIDTPERSDVFNVRYGFDLLACLAVPRPPAMVKELIRLSLVKSLSADARIRQIKDIAFDDEPRFAELAPGSDPTTNEVERRRSRRWQAIVVLEVAEHGTVTLALDGVGV